MTQTLAVDENNDLFLDTNDNIALYTDLQATLQACEQAVKTKLGEMVLDNQAGVPYFEAAFNGSPNLSILSAGIKTAILGVDGVNQVLSLEINIENDAIVYVATILTVYGEGQIGG